MIKIAKTNIELNVLRVASILGFLLYAIELYKDSVINDPIDFYIDLIAEMVFLSGIILSLNERHKNLLSLLFYIPLIGLIGTSFFYQRGLASSNEVNVLALIVVFSLTLRGWRPTAAILLLFLTTTAALVLVEQEYHFLDSFTDYYTNNFMVMFISLGVIFMVSFAKYAFTRQHNRMELVKKSLEEMTGELALKQDSLKTEKEKLERLNQELEQKVTEKTAEIQEQDKAISAYIDLALVQMQEPFEKCMKAVNDLSKNPDGNKDIDQKITDSAAHMRSEIENLKSRLEKA